MTTDASVDAGIEGAMDAGIDGALDAGFDAAVHVATNCGDFAGPNGADVPCWCGDRVNTNTVLDTSDPVVGAPCGAAGLLVVQGRILDLGGMTVAGSGTGIGVDLEHSAYVINGVVSGFGTGVRANAGPLWLTDLAVVGNTTVGLEVGDPAIYSGASVVIAGESSRISDNGGSGVLVNVGARLQLNAGTRRFPVLRNGGHGIDVRGAFSTNGAEVGWSGLHGVRVATDQSVNVNDSWIHDSGRHPDASAAGQAGVYVPRASDDDLNDVGGIGIDGSIIANNSGDGVVLGHSTDQLGVVYASVMNSQIFGNIAGIRIAETNTSDRRTSHRVLYNDIYSNADAGLHVSATYQWYDGAPGGQVFGGNDIHHNAVQSTACTGPQVSSQVVFTAPIASADPTVNDIGPDIGPDSLAYPEDAVCYWGSDLSARIDTALACETMNDPMGPESSGQTNRCAWNGSQCRVAWWVGGSPATGACDSVSNRFYGYVNDSAANPTTQRGILALGGAIVRARRNQWGIGGAANGVVTVGSGTTIDTSDDCGAVATCP